MPLNLEDKKVLVAEVTEMAKTALSVVAAEYRGLTVTQMTDLRAKARADGDTHHLSKSHRWVSPLGRASRDRCALPILQVRAARPLDLAPTAVGKRFTF